MKRIVISLLCLSLILAMLPASALAATAGKTPAASPTQGMTKQQIIDAINKKGAAFTAEMKPYKAAVESFAKAQKAFEQPKSTREAYEQAKAEWEKLNSDQQKLKNKYEAAQSDLQKAKAAYPAIRDAYLGLRNWAQTLGLNEAKGLPAEITEAEAVAALFDLPDVSALPVPLVPAEITLNAVSRSVDGVAVDSSRFGGNIRLGENEPITITNSSGEIKDVYLVRSPSSPAVKQDKVDIKVNAGSFSNKSSRGDYAVTGVNGAGLKLEVDYFAPYKTFLFSEIIVSCTRLLSKEEIPAALTEKGAAFEAAQKAVLKAQQAVTDAQKALEAANERRDAAEGKWNEAQKKWEQEKDAYASAKETFDAAEKIFREAERKYFAVRDEYQRFYKAGKADLAVLNRKAGLPENDKLPKEITEDSIELAATLSEGDLGITLIVAAIAVAGAVSIIAMKKKKTSADKDET